MLYGMLVFVLVFLPVILGTLFVSGSDSDSDSEGFSVENNSLGNDDYRNYKKPSEMSCFEATDFKRRYRKDFTLVDYTSWLLLYRRDMYNLKEYHQANLVKLLSGTALVTSDLPYQRLVPSLESSEYFSKMYDKQGRFAYEGDGLEAGGLLGANYSDYQEFIPPQLLKNTWITGKSDGFADRKNNAFAVDYYLRPASIIGDN